MVFHQQEQTSSQQQKYINTWLCGVEDEANECGSQNAASELSRLGSFTAHRTARLEPGKELGTRKGRQRADVTASKPCAVEEANQYGTGRELHETTIKGKPF